jgi:hypothetical protein
VIIVPCNQATPDWFAARIGVCTASMFRVARSRLKDGKTLTEAADDYAFGLAAQRFAGKAIGEEQFETWQMKRGQRLEDGARICHMAEIGVRVRPVGIVLSDDRAFGASADGWIGEDGGAEYKCLAGPGSMKAVYLHDDITFYMDQVQGNLWLSGRKFWDFCVYCPEFEERGLHFLRQRVYRNDDYIEQMSYELNDFNNVVNRYVEKLEMRVARREGRADAEDVPQDLAQDIADAAAHDAAHPSDF